MAGRSVYSVRKQIGVELARETPADAQPQHEGADKSDDLRQLKDQIAAMQRKIDSMG